MFKRALVVSAAALAVSLLAVAYLGWQRKPPQIAIDLSARQTSVEIAPGTSYNGWTFSGRIPGPVLRVTEGDEVVFTLHNDDLVLPHSADFHAAQTPADKSYANVPPGGSHTFTWHARYPGVFMYHCGTAPALVHVANGMYGAIIVDPKTPRRPAREFVLVQSEFYHNGTDMNALTHDTPAVVAFNGKKNRYIEKPLQALPGELVRLYVVNAGPNHFSAFHVIGAIFDKVYVDGNPRNVLHGVQTYTIPPGGAAIFELTIAEEGNYPFVSHSFADAALGAQGVLQITRHAEKQPLAP